MPLFYFRLKNGHHTIPDREGEELPDLRAAKEHAVTVARELMRNRGERVHSWRMEVCDEHLQPCFEVLFASVDETISHLRKEFRNSIEDACRNTASLNDTIVDVRKSLSAVMKTLALADDIADFTSRDGFSNTRVDQQ